jgi:hypothetical protein
VAHVRHAGFSGQRAKEGVVVHQLQTAVNERRGHVEVLEGGQRIQGWTGRGSPIVGTSKRDFTADPSGRFLARWVFADVAQSHAAGARWLLFRAALLEAPADLRRLSARIGPLNRAYNATVSVGSMSRAGRRLVGNTCLVRRMRLMGLAGSFATAAEVEGTGGPMAASQSIFGNNPSRNVRRIYSGDTRRGCIHSTGVPRQPKMMGECGRGAVFGFCCASADSERAYRNHALCMHDFCLAPA